jgi:hypothetical protein
MSNLGRDVIYTASKEVADAQNKRRRDFDAFRRKNNAGLVAIEPGDLGATGHIGHMGNDVEAGRRYAAKVVRDWGAGSSVNLQVFLDGNDCLWVTSVSEGDGPGQWVSS